MSDVTDTKKFHLHSLSKKVTKCKVLVLTDLPITQRMVAMMEIAVAVRAGGAKLVMYCMIDTSNVGNHYG